MAISTIKSILLIMVVVPVTAQIAAAQCATLYNNVASDGAGNVHAWTILTDNYTNTGSGCAPASWVATGFAHTYNASITITSPSGRRAINTATGHQTYGNGTGSIRLDDYLPVAGEVGTFTETGLTPSPARWPGCSFPVRCPAHSLLRHR